MPPEPTTFVMHKTRVAMPDSRVLTYYDFAARDAQPPHLQAHLEAATQHPPGAPRVLEHPPEMRWNPTQNEWVVIAANRMSRPMLPSKDDCPLCPGVQELPLPYQVAIFENRAPAMAYVPGDVAMPPTQDVFEVTAPARGRCDIVVYSQNHNAKMAQMPPNEIGCLVEAWRDRYAELMALPEIEFVSIFENKGREAGMTLDHPHGQIYSFPFLPPMLRTQWEQTQAFSARGNDLWEQVIAREERDGTRIIAQTEGFLAAQPFFARYPYEVHIWARRKGVCSLLEMTPQERRELAGLLKNITCRYENLWDEPKYGFPTLMLMQQMSKIRGCERYRFHVEFLPLQRSPDKLKYRASIESGAGTFLNDALPETQASELRGTAPHEIELPSVVFE
jgi:UDPglucose--hexose-1-phosphate uridylyltransferase